MDRNRHEYVLEFPAGAPHAHRRATPDGLTLRAPEPGDRAALAALILDAYRGTIDDEGESLEDALKAVDQYLAAGPLLGASCLALNGGRLVAACLAGPRWKPGPPLIWYVLTDPSHQRRGLGALVLSETLRKLRADAHAGACALITEGNVASERLFETLGFGRVEKS